MNESYIKLLRKLSEWEWYKDSKMVHLFIHLLINANFVDGRFKGKEIKRGQLATGLNSLSESTGISIQSIRTSLNKLKSTNEITSESTNDFSIITVVKYNVYQCFDKTLTSKSTSKLTNEQQTINKQVTTIEEGNKERKELKAIKISFDKSLFYDKVYFSTHFTEWTKEKKLYYYTSAIAYSTEGNKYVDWGKAISNWAKRDELQNKLKFDVKHSFVNLGGIV